MKKFFKFIYYIGALITFFWIAAGSRSIVFAFIAAILWPIAVPILLLFAAWIGGF